MNAPGLDGIAIQYEGMKIMDDGAAIPHRDHRKVVHHRPGDSAEKNFYTSKPRSWVQHLSCRPENYADGHSMVVSSVQSVQ